MPIVQIASHTLPLRHSLAGHGVLKCHRLAELRALYLFVTIHYAWSHSAFTLFYSSELMLNCDEARDRACIHGAVSAACTKGVRDECKSSLSALTVVLSQSDLLLSLSHSVDTHTVCVKSMWLRLILQKCFFSIITVQFSDLEEKWVACSWITWNPIDLLIAVQTRLLPYLVFKIQHFFP